MFMFSSRSQTIALLQLRSFCFKRCIHQTPAALSGHNKWSKIKQKKGVADVKKSSVYSKAAKDVMVAIRSGGSADPTLNSALANVLRAAKAAGVPKENVERAIARATGEGDKITNSHVVYEAIVAGKVAIVIECLTDNGNRTIHKLREILNDYSARFAPVMFLFDRVGRVQVSVSLTDDRDSKIEALLEAAGSAGGEDFEIIDGSDIVEYFCPPESLEPMAKAISSLIGGEKVVSSEHIYRVKDSPEEVEEELEDAVVGLRDALNEDADCIRVWTTIDSRIRDSDEE